MRVLTADERPAPHMTSSRRPLRRWPVPFAGICLVSAGLLAAMALPRQDEAAAPAAAAVSPAGAVSAPAWIDIVKPVEMFGVSAAGFDKLPRSYMARRNRLGGGRQDFLSLGVPDGTAPYLRLSIYRVGSEASADVPLFVDVARRAADAGLGIQKSGPPHAVTTRFGRFEAIDLELAGTSGLTCAGFRLGIASPDLRIAGLTCGPQRKPTTPADLTCLLERIDLNAAGDDEALARFFADSELSRDPSCAGAAMAPTPLHAPWLDDKPTPATRRAAARTGVKAQMNQRPSRTL